MDPLISGIRRVEELVEIAGAGSHQRSDWALSSKEDDSDSGIEETLLDSMRR
jgi:hypothetical protein